MKSADVWGTVKEAAPWCLVAAGIRTALASTENTRIKKRILT